MAPRVYKLAEVRQELEKYAPGDQMRRVAVSIPANQAEGRSRMHTAEFQQFVSRARGSLAELETLLNLGESLGQVRAQRLSKLRQDLQTPGHFPRLYFSPSAENSATPARRRVQC